MSLFDLYACLDYSGAKSRTLQRKHIVLAQVISSTGRVVVTTGKDREEMSEFLLGIFRDATQKGWRIVLGVDHNFGFPRGFYETLTGYPLNNWRQWLDLMQYGPLSLDFADGDARSWAQMINGIIHQRLRTGSGPFWGPGFSVMKKPGFPYGRSPFRERRLIEERIPRTQPVFKLGGAGAVGLQSIYGIYHLAWLAGALAKDNISCFFWPFDGFEPPVKHHVLLEIYPGIINPGPKSDMNDAGSGARWLQESDRNDRLANYFRYTGSQDLINQIRSEGWIIGMPFQTY